MPDSRVSRVPIFTAPRARHTGAAAELPAEERWQSCRISADVATALGIPAADLSHGAETYQVRISVTEADVNVLFNPGYLEFLGKSDSFVVSGLANGSHRVEIHPNSGPGAKDGGVFKLFGGGNPFTGASIPTNARVTLWRDELSPDRVEEPADGTGDDEDRHARSGADAAPDRFGRPKRDKARWLMALPMLCLPLF